MIQDDKQIIGALKALKDVNEEAYLELFGWFKQVMIGLAMKSCRGVENNTTIITTKFQGAVILLEDLINLDLNLESLYEKHYNKSKLSNLNKEAFR